MDVCTLNPSDTFTQFKMNQKFSPRTKLQYFLRSLLPNVFKIEFLIYLFIPVFSDQLYTVNISPLTQYVLQSVLPSDPAERDTSYVMTTSRQTKSQDHFHSDSTVLKEVS